MILQRMNKGFSALFGATLAAFAFAGAAQASVIYANNAGTPWVESYDATTGSQIFKFIGNGSNGRGVVVVGEKVYTTNANNGQVGIYDRTTGASLGGFTITNGGTPVGGISTIGYDGDNFWTSDYTGNNNAYLVDGTTGVVLKTITLSESLGYYDGLEYFDNKLIANEFDGGLGGGNRYSVYDTNGFLLIEDFIDTTGYGNGTGIAYDGTNFYISDIMNGRATIWSGVDGSYLGALALLGTANLIEDLSFDYEDRPDTCRVKCNGNGHVPEPGPLGLLGLGLLILPLVRRRKLLR